MRRSLPAILAWVALLAIPGTALVYLQLDSSADHALSAHAPTGHFYIVSAVSLVTVGLGLMAGFAALRCDSARLLLLAASFMSMAGLFAVHGLATPGFVLDAEYFGVTGFSSRLAVLVASLLLAGSAVPWPSNIERRLVAWRLPIFGGCLLALAAYAAIALSAPSHLPPRVITDDRFLDTATLLGVLATGFAAIRYLDGFRRSRLPLYGAVAIGSVLILQAQIAIHVADTWMGSFWLYHLQLLLGFSAIFWGILLEYARGTGLSRSFEQLSISDPLAQIEAGYHESIVSFAAALEARDGYTLGHGRRVAALAVHIARRLQLSPERTRALAQGSLLHDIGKIGVPDNVLHKPGPLTPEEYEIVKEHPTRGEAMLRAGFDGAIERAVIRHHHERFDGAGYPDRLQGSAIPLEARIAAIADVYDALRSARAYRDAWPREAALTHMRAESGGHFDPACIAAFNAVVQEWERQFAADHELYQERRAS